MTRAVAKLTSGERLMGELMSCKALWDEDLLRIGEALTGDYVRRLEAEGLLELARQRQHTGDAGGAGRDESDRHFAYQFANSAGRVVYVCIDPGDHFEGVSAQIRQFFTDGRVLLLEVPCGSGGGTLGLLSALHEQRKAEIEPQLPVNIDILGADISVRAVEHFRALVESLSPSLKETGVEVVLDAMEWDASDLRSSSRLIDRAIHIASDCDQVFLLVSNFSDALVDEELKVCFEHFLAQLSARVTEPYAICWVEPVSNQAEKILSIFDRVLGPLAKWLRFSGKGTIEGVRYRLLDPVNEKPVRSGVRVLKATQEGSP